MVYTAVLEAVLNCVRVRVSPGVPHFSTANLNIPMSYNRELETNRNAKQAHDETLKKNAAERLKRNAEWNRKNKTK